MGYQQSKNASSLFLNKSSSHLTIVAVYVDDILVTASSSTEIHNLKHQLNTLFGIKDLGHLHYFLGMEVTPFPYGLWISQEEFLKE